jgi:hypothetical protein
MPASCTAQTMPVTERILTCLTTTWTFEPLGAGPSATGIVNQPTGHRDAIPRHYPEAMKLSPQHAIRTLACSSNNVTTSTSIIEIMLNTPMR